MVNVGVLEYTLLLRVCRNGLSPKAEQKKKMRVLCTIMQII